jgi:hypothetical protein
MRSGSRGCISRYFGRDRLTLGRTEMRVHCLYYGPGSEKEARERTLCIPNSMIGYNRATAPGGLISGCSAHRPFWFLCKIVSPLFGF